jgi:hypothetical protein
MQGPVGLRCPDCGRPPQDALTTPSRRQLVAGLAVALGGGTIGGSAGLQMGIFLSLCAGPFIGALISEGVMRATGYKRGPVARTIVVGGIVCGVLIAALLQSVYLWGVFGFDAGVGSQAVMTYVWVVAGTNLIYVAAALVGAFARLR